MSETKVLGEVQTQCSISKDRGYNLTIASLLGKRSMNRRRSLATIRFLHSWWTPLWHLAGVQTSKIVHHHECGIAKRGAVVLVSSIQVASKSEYEPYCFLNQYDEKALQFAYLDVFN